MRNLIKSTLLLLALLLPATALAHDFCVDGIYYNINGNEAKVTYKGGDYINANSYTGAVEIPASVTYNGNIYSVTTIGYCAFYECTGLTSVSIGNSVTSIGLNAFRRCSNLKSIIIPNSVTTIGNEAFYECIGLTTVIIPNSVTTLGYASFAMCSSLTDVYCYISNPSAISNESAVFYLYPSDYSNRILHVPHTTSNAYIADENWRPYFAQIVEIEPEYLLGDANADGSFNIGDVCDTIDYLLGNEITPFNPAGADLNGNGRVDMGDLTDLIDLLLTNN